MYVKVTYTFKKQNARWWHYDVVVMQLTRAFKKVKFDIPDLDTTGMMEIKSKKLNHDNNEYTVVKHWTPEGWETREKFLAPYKDLIETRRKLVKEKFGIEYYYTVEYIT